MPTIREWLHRLLGTLRPRRGDADLQEELRVHMELASEDAQRRGEPVRAARLHAGGVSQAMDSIRDQRGWPWLHSVASDLVFAWRQLRKHRTASLAAILSLGLAVGATTAAFRLLDAVLLRTLPVAEPDRLFVLGWNSMTSQGEPDYRDDFDYPTFRRYRVAIGPNGDVLVVGTSARQLALVDNSTEPEPVIRQYYSGNVFPTFGLQPTLGRLLTPSDDVTPGGHPVAVISYDYWTRRFARDPNVIGRSFRIGRQPFEIVGVGPKGFTGTEPGRMADLFVPAMMNAQALNAPGWSWFRIWVRPTGGVSVEQVREMVQAQLARDRQDTVKNFPSTTPGPLITAYLNEKILLAPAGSGASGPQRTFRRPLFILAGLVVLVLLIACANVANLLTAQAITRAREMALRVSIGAGRWRLIQLVLVESALLAICASVVGAVFAWWAAPFVISLLSQIGEPIRLVLDLDWRSVAFSLALTLTVTVLFGTAPALRASAVQPLGAIKGHDDPHAHRRLVRSLIGGQMAFCLFVLFVAGLFATTLRNLSNRPLGFESERILLLDINRPGERQPLQVWTALTDQIRGMPGVESAALATWAPLSENRWRWPVYVAPRQAEAVSPYFLGISPAYFDTMRIGMVGGRDFRIDDTAPTLDREKRPVPGVGIVNETFSRIYFGAQNPVGRQVIVRPEKDIDVPMEIVGVVRDAVYYDLREPMRPTVYVPIEAGNQRTLFVRTAGDPRVLAATMRSEVSRTYKDTPVLATTQSTLIRRQVVRERLLATLSLFFAVLALLLAGIGLFGVLNYAVIQQRREIGVRMALGARAPHVVKRVVTEMLNPVGVGAVLGLALALVFGRLVESILFEVKATDASTIATPLLTLAVAAALAAVPPAIRAVRIDPAQTLRSD
jgi:putative ABC transport system permease protein